MRGFVKQKMTNVREPAGTDKSQPQMAKLPVFVFFFQFITAFQVLSFSFNFFFLIIVLLSQFPEVLDDKETGGEELKFPFKGRARVCVGGGGGV